MPRPPELRPHRRLHRRRLLALAAASLLAVHLPARPAALDLVRLDALRGDQGVLLNFETRFDLPPAVEDALSRGIALHFSAEAVLMQARWYWRDKELARVSRTWRLPRSNRRAPNCCSSAWMPLLRACWVRPVAAAARV